jgi:hypothetical protein
MTAFLQQHLFTTVTFLVLLVVVAVVIRRRRTPFSGSDRRSVVAGVLAVVLALVHRAIYS